jgi:hypothetical protein
VPLDEPRELLAGLRVPLLEEEPLAVLVELRGGSDGVRTPAQKAAAREQENDGSEGECSSPERPSSRIA